MRRLDFILMRRLVTEPATLTPDERERAIEARRALEAAVIEGALREAFNGDIDAARLLKDVGVLTLDPVEK